MNMATLQEQIKEEIVLRRGQVKERQWRQTGLPDEAAREGITAEDFRRIVNEVSRQLNFEKLTDLRRRLDDALDAPPQYKLHQTQEDDFVAEGVRMGLSASFMEDRWIPQLITDLKKENTPAETPPEAVVPSPEPAIPSLQASSLTPPEPSTPNLSAEIPSAPALRERVKTILDEYQGHVSARDLRLLFRAMHTDERLLAEEILAYFSANFYASETEPQGATLPEKLLSTDWRHLAWWDKAPVSEPVSAAEPMPVFVSPVPEPAPSYIAPISTLQPLSPPPPSSSNAGLWGAVFAVVVLLILYFLIKPNQKATRKDQDTDQTEQPQKTRKTDQNATDKNGTERNTRDSKRQRDESVRDDSPDNQTDESAASDERPREPKPTTKPVPIDESTAVEDLPKPAKKYDRLLETTGQFGEQPAKLGRKWGLWRSGDWMIYPIYDDITTFRDGRATVVRNGKTYDIDEKGNPVQE